LKPGCTFERPAVPGGSDLLQLSDFRTGRDPDNGIEAQVGVYAWLPLAFTVLLAYFSTKIIFDSLNIFYSSNTENGI
jgi:hypothetical protein